MGNNDLINGHPITKIKMNFHFEKRVLGGALINAGEPVLFFNCWRVYSYFNVFNI